METRFLLEGYKRKDLAKALAGILETEVNYLGMPSMSYRIGNSFLEKDGTFISVSYTHLVEPGDVWTVGRHRLICGDATKPEDVEKLMDKKKANLILTDPPYAVSYESASGLSIKNDNLKAEEFYDFLLSSFKNMIEVSEAGASAYVFHADTEGLTFRKAFEDAGFHLSGVCIWAKDSLVLGRSPYQWSHEPILFGWNKKGKHEWYAGRAEKTVWQFNKPKKNENHPTSKPIDLLSLSLIHI